MRGASDQRLGILQVVSHAAGQGRRRGVGGEERRVLESIRYWDLTRFRLVVTYSPLGQLWPDFEAATRARDITLLPFDAPRRRDWRALPQMVRFIRDHRIDVVHSQGPHGTDWWAATAARLTRRAAIVTRPIALTDYTLPRLTHLRFLALDRLALSGVYRMAFVSEDARTKALAAGETVPRRAVLIRNGVDTRRFAPRPGDPAALGLPAGTPLFGMLAQLLPVKGWDTFLEVAGLVRQRVPAARAVIVGAGPEEARLRAAVHDQGLESHVIFAGFHADVPDILRHLDVVLLTSRREGLPVAIVEAMAMAKPVVATDVGGVREVVVPGQTGFLEPPGAAAAIARHVVTLLEDAALRARLGAAARAFVLEHASLEAQVRAYERLYEEAAAPTLPRDRRAEAVDSGFAPLQQQ